MVVKQECPSIAADAPLKFLHISLAFLLTGILDVHTVIVVAHHGIHAIRGMQLAEVTLESVQLRALVIHQITRKEDGITMLRIDEFHHFPYIVLMPIAKSANVHIGDMGNAVALITLGKVGEIECLSMNHIVMPANEIAEAQNA